MDLMASFTDDSSYYWAQLSIPLASGSSKLASDLSVPISSTTIDLVSTIGFSYIFLTSVGSRASTTIWGTLSPSSDWCCSSDELDDSKSLGNSILFSSISFLSPLSISVYSSWTTEIPKGVGTTGFNGISSVTTPALSFLIWPPSEIISQLLTLIIGGALTFVRVVYFLAPTLILRLVLILFVLPFFVSSLFKVKSVVALSRPG